MENLWTAFCMWERSTKGDKASLRNVRELIALPRDKLLIVLEAMKSSKTTACASRLIEPTTA